MGEQVAEAKGRSRRSVRVSTSRGEDGRHRNADKIGAQQLIKIELKTEPVI